MTSFDEKKACAYVLDRLDAFVDGDLPATEVEEIKAHLDTCRDCTDELAAARSLKEQLHGLPKLRCPDSVVERVIARAEGTSSKARWLAVGRFRWAAALAATILVVAALNLGRDRPSPPSDSQYSREEVALAKYQVELTLAYVAQVGRRSLSTVGKTVIEDKIIVPVRDSLMRNLLGRTDAPETSGS